jgi:hypothetical protein
MTDEAEQLPAKVGGNTTVVKEIKAKKLKAKVDKDGWYTLDIDKMFDDYITSTQKTWAHDRSKTIGASEVFSCMRKVFFDKRGEGLGFQPDSDFRESWGATRRGDLIENYHVVPALQHGMPEELTLSYVGENQVTLVLDKNSGTPDGFLTGLPKGGNIRVICGGHVVEIHDLQTGCIGLEFKSIDPRATLAEERAKHHGQCQVGMGLIREKTKWKPEHWLILYFDASFLDKMTPFLVEWEPGIWEAAKLRAPAIWEYDSPLSFQAEGKITGECAHCKWTQACGEATISEILRTRNKCCEDPEVVEAIRAEVNEFMARKAAFDLAKAEFDDAKDAVKARLAQLGERKVKGPEFSATWSYQDGTTRYDVKRIAEDHNIDLEEYKIQGAPFDKLTVRKRGKNDTGDD